MKKNILKEAREAQDKNSTYAPIYPFIETILRERLPNDHEAITEFKNSTMSFAYQKAMDSFSENFGKMSEEAMRYVCMTRQSKKQ